MDGITSRFGRFPVMPRSRARRLRLHSTSQHAMGVVRVLTSGTRKTGNSRSSNRELLQTGHKAQSFESGFLRGTPRGGRYVRANVADPNRGRSSFRSAKTRTFADAVSSRPTLDVYGDRVTEIFRGAARVHGRTWRPSRNSQKFDSQQTPNARYACCCFITRG